MYLLHTINWQFNNNKHPLVFFLMYSVISIHFHKGFLSNIIFLSLLSLLLKIFVPCLNTVQYYEKLITSSIKQSFYFCSIEYIWHNFDVFCSFLNLCKCLVFWYRTSEWVICCDFLYFTKSCHCSKNAFHFPYRTHSDPLIILKLKTCEPSEIVD